MKACTLLTSVLLAVLLFAALWPFVSIKVWDGSYTLNVNIEVLDASQVEFAAVQVVYGSSGAEELIASRHNTGWIAAPKRFVGTTILLEAEVPTSGRIDCFGRELRYSQWRVLVVQWQDARGNKFTRYFDVPDGRASQSISISLP